MSPPAARATAAPASALWLLAVLATLWSLRLAADLLIPIVLGMLLALALEPIVAWLVRRGVPRGLAAALVLGLLLVAIAATLWSLRGRLSSALGALPAVARRLSAFLESALATVPIDSATQALQSATGGDPVVEVASNAGPPLAQMAMAGLGHLTVIVFFVFFLLHSGPRMAARITESAGTPERRAQVARILGDVNGQVQRFLLVQAVTSAIVAVATWLVLAWMGVTAALLWGLLAGLFNSIPYFGPVVVSGGLFLVGLVQDGGVEQALRMSGAALLITSLEGWLITPVLLGRAERMNVLTVFVGLLVWTWVWGPWGTLLAVPMLSVLKSVADHVERLRPLALLMGTDGAERRASSGGAAAGG